MVADKIRADAEAARIESEWKFAAMVNIFFGQRAQLSLTFTLTVYTSV